MGVGPGVLLFLREKCKYRVRQYVGVAENKQPKESSMVFTRIRNERSSYISTMETSQVIIGHNGIKAQ